MKAIPYANMHLHSTHSDGVYSPTELVRIAKAEGYRALALTDHDTGSGYTELRAACEAEGMECLFGVEFSVTSPAPFHIVGFGFDPDYPEMREYLDLMAYKIRENTRLCFLEAVENGGIAGITWDEVLEYNAGIPWLCNNHVFRAMQSKGLIRENEYMSWFNKNFRDQRGKHQDDGCFKPLGEMVDLIKRAGGFAVCAHPTDDQLDKLDMLLEAGIEGLEVMHPNLNEERRARSRALCLEHGLYISGGSDHSGLCGGYYGSYDSEEALRASRLYIEPLSAGVEEQYFRELQAHKIMR